MIKQADKDVKPNLPAAPVINAASDEFNKKLGPQWQFRRNPDYANISLKEKKGNLRIYTSDYDIDTIAGRNILVQRERWLKYTALTKMVFNLQTREQAGLTCHFDTKTYARFGLQRDGLGKLQLVLEEMKFGVSAVNYIVADIKSTELYLKVDVNMLSRKFFYSYDNKNWMSAGIINDAAYLSAREDLIGVLWE